MTTYIPTATELEELGFEVKDNRYILTIDNGFTKAYIEFESTIYGKAFIFSIQGAGVIIYPRSLSDLRTLISLFTPNP